MEIIVNSLLEFMGEQNVLTYDKVIEIVFKELGIDLTNKHQKYQEQVTCVERDTYVKNLPNGSGMVYIKWLTISRKNRNEHLHVNNNR